MRHSYYGRKLSRTANERRRLLQGLARDVIVHGKIQTTLAKAKAVQPLIEKLVTNAKKGTNAGDNEIRKVLADKKTVSLLLDDAKGRFSGRTSGYTRIIKSGVVRSDAARMAILSFVDQRVVSEPQVKKIKKEKGTKTTEKQIKKSKVKHTGKKRLVKKQ